MRKDTFFRLSRLVLLLMVISSVLIPFIPAPQLSQPFVQVKLEPIFQNTTIIEEPIQTNAAPTSIQLSAPASNTNRAISISPKTILLFVYFCGLFISILILLYSITTILLLFQKARKMDQNGLHLRIVSEDTPAFSFGRYILISQFDYDIHSEAIITHEQSHIRLGHFYDLMLMELTKIIFWFNPLVYRMVSDLKEIHEFQADNYTLNQGIDATQYQLLIIQKCVGHQKFALANSFNHCQIKNRITMMNKQKTSKASSWKVATFLPLLALLLMAFGRTGESVTLKEKVTVNVIAPQETRQTQNEQTSRLIEIKSEGNYIDNKLCSMEEVVKKGKEWGKASNDWIHLQIDQSIPYNRVDEILEQLEAASVYHITQSTVNSDEIIYPAGDVTELAKFTNGKWDDWMKNQLKHFSEGKPTREYKIRYSFIIDKNGKVRDGHIIKGSDYPEINTAYEQILTQIPDWKPAKRLGTAVNVYYRIWASRKVFPVETKK
jgi:beta-lactamase regulating signal transducer with metallopeptidase domain